MRSSATAEDLPTASFALCGQLPSDYPEFARFLVGEGIDSISFTPDALIKGIENINAAEKIKNPPLSEG